MIVRNDIISEAILGISVGDLDAAAFISAVIANNGLLDANSINAIVTLVSSLKSSGLWSKIKAFYPFVGGTKGSCSQNLISSRYAGTFQGDWTYSLNGVTGDRATTYMATGILPNSIMSYTSQHYLVYIPTGIDGSSPYECLIGAVTAGSEGINFYLNAEGSAYMTVNEFVTGNAFDPQSGNGCWMVNLLSGTKTLYRNGSTIGTKTGVTPTNYSLPELYIGARNTPDTNKQWSNNEISCVSIGDGLTSAEATTLYNAIQTFQTSLNREV